MSTSHSDTLEPPQYPIVKRSDQNKPPSFSPARPSTQPSQQKKIPRRSSKPIINWFQRKLAGTVKPKRVENLPLTIADLGKGRSRNPSTRVAGRVASSPLPSPVYISPLQQRLDANAARRKTISLNGGEDDARDFHSYTDENSASRSSLARDSMWSPSALEADEDASVRPIPPSSPPSPSPSRSSSSYLSDPRTFRSMAASTKPTTILSVDMHGNGMAHIAQAPLTPSSQVHRITPHIRQSSSLSATGVIGGGSSITFSALPQSSSGPSSVRLNSLSPPNQTVAQSGNNTVSPVQAPLHTTHHPRNNPRPSSPPLDNASVLTLASSAFAFTTPARHNTQGHGSTASALGGGDSTSHFGGSTYADAESTSQFVVGDDIEERDVDASVRALRPRSSRRGSWESEVSRWSARIQPGAGTSSLARERSLWTSNSVRTGGFSMEQGETYDKSDDVHNEEVLGTAVENSSEKLPPSPEDVELIRPSDLASTATYAGGEGTTKGITASSSSSNVTRQLSSETVAQLATVSNVCDTKGVSFEPPASTEKVIRDAET